jgi:hypothetical protein
MRDCPGHRGRRIGHYVISEQPLAADEWAAERAAQIEAPTIVNRTDGKSRNRTSPLIAHYILSDKPMTEDEWMMRRTIVERNEAEKRSLLRPGHDRRSIR